MGYTTEFTGKITITPPLPPKLVTQINSFCEERHEDGYSSSDSPSIWCDWAVDEDGSYISWNGNEKSYEMSKWLPVLIRKFMTGHCLNGRLLAQGEDGGDTWVLECKDNVVSKQGVNLLKDLGITR